MTRPKPTHKYKLSRSAAGRRDTGLIDPSSYFPDVDGQGSGFAGTFDTGSLSEQTMPAQGELEEYDDDEARSTSGICGSPR